MSRLGSKIKVALLQVHSIAGRQLATCLDDEDWTERSLLRLRAMEDEAVRRLLVGHEFDHPAEVRIVPIEEALHVLRKPLALNNECRRRLLAPLELHLAGREHVAKGSHSREGLCERGVNPVIHVGL